MSRRNILTWLLSLAVAFPGATAANAQWPKATPPASSPYWWTLSPEITPAELRKRHQDRGRHREAYRRQQKAHGMPEPTAEQLAEVTLFIDGSTTPELFRLVDAYDGVLVLFNPEMATALADLRAKSHAYGMSDEGLSLFWTVSAEARQARLRGIAAVAADSVRFTEVLENAATTLGREKLRAILRRKDLASLTSSAGLPLAELSRLAAAWDRDAVEEVDLAALESLRQGLSAADWEAMRRFLLHEVATEMALLHTEDEFAD